MADRRSFAPRPGTKRLVVLADSLAFCDERGPQLPDTDTLYPNRIAAALGLVTGEVWSVSVVARPGADVRDAWRWVSKDRHIQFETLAPADAVVVAIGSFDHAPIGVPRWIEVAASYLHPSPVRRRVRAWLAWSYPRIARTTRGRFVRTPPAEFERLYALLLRQVVGLTQGEAAVVTMGPTSHRGSYYGEGHPRRDERSAAQRAIAASLGIGYVDPWPLVEPHADRLNVDGIHWPGSAHAAMAGALSAILIEQLQGTRPLPPAPQ